MSTETNSEPQFFIQRIYVKNSSFETTNTPEAFQKDWKPELSLDVNTKHKKLDETVFEVSLTVTVTVKNESSVAFLAEVEQAGIFSIQGMESGQLDQVLGSFCPNILFPYAREMIGSQVTHGSFPQLALAPINFDALYAQQKEAQQSGAATQVQEEKTH